MKQLNLSSEQEIIYNTFTMKLSPEMEKFSEKHFRKITMNPETGNVLFFFKERPDDPYSYLEFREGSDMYNNMKQLAEELFSK